MERLILVRHAHAASNARDVVNGVPPGEGLSPEGVEQARALGRMLTSDDVDLGLATGLERTQETLRLALDGRDVPIAIFQGLREIGFGRFEGGALADYRRWAWSTEPAAPCPGGGESRADAAARLAGALEELLEHPHEAILLVSHALPIRYVLDAADRRLPRRRIEPVPHAVPFRLGREPVAVAAAALRAWAAAPRFADPPQVP